MSTEQFNEERFKAWTDCETWPLFVHLSGHWRLFDHGFIANRACVWGYPDLEGSEMAIVSRTYCAAAEIDNPPAGLLCVRLPDHLLGGDPGKVIATVITGPTEAAEDFLQACLHLPAELFPYALPRSMDHTIYRATLAPGSGNTPRARIGRTLDDPAHSSLTSTLVPRSAWPRPDADHQGCIVDMKRSRDMTTREWHEREDVTRWAKGIFGDLAVRGFIAIFPDDNEEQKEAILKRCEVQAALMLCRVRQDDELCFSCECTVIIELANGHLVEVGYSEHENVVFMGVPAPARSPEEYHAMIYKTSRDCSESHTT